MNSYTSSFGNEWSTPDTMKRYSMYLTPKGEGEYATNGRGPKSLSDRFFLGRVTITQCVWPLLPVPVWWLSVPPFMLK